MVWRSRVILTRSSRGWSARGPAAGAGAGAAGAGMVGAAETAFTASALVILPLGPVAAMVIGSRAFSVTTRWTAGDRCGDSDATGAEPLLAGAAGAGSATGAGAGAGVASAAGAADAPSVITPSTAPGVTVAPSAARISDRTPSDGDTISSETLSVSSSTRTSSFFTASPACFVHLPMVASVTDSPRAGVRMSAISRAL